MKLRNKKTGGRGCIAEFNNYFIVVYPVNEKWNAYNDEKYVYYSVSEFCEDWEDAKEPLIKDPKIRKAVKAWAEALNVDAIRFERFSQGFSFGDGNMYSSINFDGCVFDLADGKEYTIEELCGEEEE